MRGAGFVEFFIVFEVVWNKIFVVIGGRTVLADCRPGDSYVEGYDWC